MSTKKEPLDFYLEIRRTERLDLISRMQIINSLIDVERHGLSDSDFIDKITKCKNEITELFNLDSNQYNSLYNVVKHLPSYSAQLVDRYIRRHLR